MSRSTVPKTVYHGGKPIAAGGVLRAAAFASVRGEELSARQVEAFLILEKELAAELETPQRAASGIEMATFPQLKTGAVAQYPR
jgi:hypothetical protein